MLSLCVCVSYALTLTHMHTLEPIPRTRDRLVLMVVVEHERSMRPIHVHGFDPIHWKLKGCQMCIYFMHFPAKFATGRALYQDQFPLYFCSLSPTNDPKLCPPTHHIVYLVLSKYHDKQLQLVSPNASGPEYR